MAVAEKEIPSDAQPCQEYVPRYVMRAETRCSEGLPMIDDERDAEVFYFPFNDRKYIPRSDGKDMLVKIAFNVFFVSAFLFGVRAQFRLAGRLMRKVVCRC